MKNTIIGLRELRENINKYIAQVEKGDSFTVVRKSKPVFKMSPLDRESDAWEAVADFTRIKKGGVSAGEILRELRKLNA